MKYFTPTKLSENMRETPEGFLLCLDVSIARTGQMKYGPDETPLETGAQGIVIISRDEDEIFRPETIASFEGKPVTIQHPTEFVTPENWSRLAKGSVQNVRRGEGEYKDDLIADLLITDKDAINLVKNGLREVSCGYEAEYVQTAEGKGIQTNIIGNHLALVEQGRAGSGYAINDKKGVFTMGVDKVKETVKKIFGKAQDDAMNAIEDAGGPDITSKNQKYEAEGKGYDELVKSVKDLAGKIESMKPKDAASAEAAAGQGERTQGPAEARGAYDADAVEERLKKLEMMCSQLMEKMASKEGGDADMEEKAEDDDMESMDEDMDESEDDDFEESSMTGDTASRAEILSPGIKKSKSVKIDALKAAWGTKDGKRIIEALNGGKTPDFKSEKEVDHLFRGTSEVMKLSRKDAVKQTKVTDFGSTIFREGPMTAEKLNEINAKFYNRK